MAAALALGAAGAVVGTRFAVSKESLYSDAKKQRYIPAKGGDTVRNRLYDDLGLVEWPRGIDGRLIGNTVTSKYGYAAPQKVTSTQIALFSQSLLKLSGRYVCLLLILQSTLAAIA